MTEVAQYCVRTFYASTKGVCKTFDNVEKRIIIIKKIDKSKDEKLDGHTQLK